MSAIDCPFRTAVGSCRHVDKACGREVKSFTDAKGNTYPFGEDACLYCIKQYPDPAQRHHSKPVADWIRNSKGEPPEKATKCVHRGAFIRSNEDKAKRHCGVCAYYECEMDQGDDGIIRPDLHCGKQCNFYQIAGVASPSPPPAETQE